MTPEAELASLNANCPTRPSVEVVETYLRKAYDLGRKLERDEWLKITAMADKLRAIAATGWQPDLPPGFDP